MNTQEFKAWFEGFTESMSGPPSKKAWARIKERVAEIQPGVSVSTSYPVFIERYYPYYTPTFGNLAGSAIGNAINNAVPFNASDAFTALGRADASAIQ